MLKVSPGEGGSFFNADKRKKQVTLVDPTAGQSSSADDRRPTVAAPKMFAFDAIFTEEDSQVSSFRDNSKATILLPLLLLLRVPRAKRRNAAIERRWPPFSLGGGFVGKAKELG